MADSGTPADTVELARQAVEVARAAMTRAPTDASTQAGLVQALHVYAARLYVAGRQPESVGLGIEGTSILSATTATGDDLRGIAENLIHLAGYLPAGDEAVTASAAGTATFRVIRAANPGAVIDTKLAWALHATAGRYYVAGRQPESVGLGIEGTSILSATTATGDDLRGIAENLIHLAGYLPAGDEAVTASAAGTATFRVIRAANPGAVIDTKLAWALHATAGRYYVAGRQPESVGLGIEGTSILSATTATGDDLRGIAENLIHLAGYLPAGDEAVTASAAGTATFRVIRAANPGAVIDTKLAWALHATAGWAEIRGRATKTLARRDPRDVIGRLIALVRKAIQVRSAHGPADPARSANFSSKASGSTSNVSTRTCRSTRG